MCILMFFKKAVALCTMLLLKNFGNYAMQMETFIKRNIPASIVSGVNYFTRKTSSMKIGNALSILASHWKKSQKRIIFSDFLNIKKLLKHSLQLTHYR